MDVIDRIPELIRAGDLEGLQESLDVAPQRFADDHWFRAIATGRVDICQILVAAGLSPHRTRFARTPLHAAASNDKLEIVKWLLKLGADPNVLDSEGYTPLDLAYTFVIAEPSRELVGCLVAAGTEISIWTAVRMGDWERVSAVLGAAPHLLDAHSEYLDFTPLMVAARMNRLEVAESLILRGANLNAVCKKFDNGMGGNTPLWFAAQGDREGREEMVRLLLKHGAAVNFAGEYGWTALHMSAQWNHPEIARVLVEHGAEASCRDEEGRTPLDIAEKHGSEAARSYLATVA